MYHALATASQTQVSNVIIVAVIIAVAVMAFWRQILVALVAVFVATVTIGFAAVVLLLLHHGLT